MLFCTMPRPPRIDFPDAFYHVTSRGNGRADIFSATMTGSGSWANWPTICSLAAVTLYAYVLMDNHFHLWSARRGRTCRRFMQRLLTAYALYSRYKHRRPGHLFQGRFKAKLVEDEATCWPLRVTSI